jgi:hypothetical protein
MESQLKIDISAFPILVPDETDFDGHGHKEVA